MSDIRQVLEDESLKEAKSRNYLKCVQRAIKAGADVNKIKLDADGNPTESVLSFALGITQTLSMAKLLVQNGAKVTDKWSISHQDRGIVRYKDVLSKLCWAADRWDMGEFQATFKYLVSKGAVPVKALRNCFIDCTEGCCTYNRDKKAFVEEQIQAYRKSVWPNFKKN